MYLSVLSCNTCPPMRVCPPHRDPAAAHATGAPARNPLCWPSGNHVVRVCMWSDMSQTTLHHHRDTPQHTVTQCNIVQHSATQCNTVQHTAIQWHVVEIQRHVVDVVASRWMQWMSLNAMNDCNSTACRWCRWIAVCCTVLHGVVDVNDFTVCIKLAIVNNQFQCPFKWHI